MRVPLSFSGGVPEMAMSEGSPSCEDRGVKSLHHPLIKDVKLGNT